MNQAIEFVLIINCLQLMNRTVFYLAGSRLSTVFCTLTQAGVQSTNVSSKTKAAISVLLPYMLIYYLSEVIITFNSRVHPNKELLYLDVLCSQYRWKSWKKGLLNMKSFLCHKLIRNKVFLHFKIIDSLLFIAVLPINV